MAYMPGQEIQARCTRCRDVTGHVIVLVLDGRVAKVQCHACGSVHKYYPAEPAAKEAAPRVMRVRSGMERDEAVREEAHKSAARAPAPKKAEKGPTRQERLQADRELQWRTAIARTAGTPAPYAMDGKFAQGTLVEHPSFGTGFVVELTPPDKMLVLFREGAKALRCQC